MSAHNAFLRRIRFMASFVCYTNTGSRRKVWRCGKGERRFNILPRGGPGSDGWVFLFLPRKWSPDKLSPSSASFRGVHKFLWQPRNSPGYFYYRRLIAPSPLAPRMEEDAGGGDWEGVLWRRSVSVLAPPRGGRKEQEDGPSRPPLGAPSPRLCEKQVTCLCHLTFPMTTWVLLLNPFDGRGLGGTENLSDLLKATRLRWESPRWPELSRH